MSVQTQNRNEPGTRAPSRVRAWPSGGIRDRSALIVALIIVLLIVMAVLDAAGVTSARFNSDYLANALIGFVPLALLALAELFVITSGRGGIDLSVGSMVSLVGMVFGILYGQWGWPFLAAFLAAVLLGALLGAINGVLTAYLGYPALITTLATFYAYRSIALVITDSTPISGPEVQGLYSAAAAIELPLIGASLPLVPLGVFTFLLPIAVVAWFVLNRTQYGRKLYAIGTNDTAAQWAGIDTRRTRMFAFVIAGVISGIVAVYTVAQFASARPDAGTSGSGMALPAITIAVLGGVAISGGIGKLSGILLAALLVVWLNASILIVVPGNEGAQMQLLALGVVLLGASLFGGVSQRRAKSGLARPAVPVTDTTPVPSTTTGGGAADSAPGAASSGSSTGSSAGASGDEHAGEGSGR